ncbi:MAG TPA: hypothetical protein VEH28_02280 [Thermoplasmata archaeon]|nr:hypothetical protein [Thermoplasmata archaeon]
MAWGTQILTPNGVVAIQSLSIGSKVMEYDFATGGLTVGTLVSANTTQASEVIVINHNLRVTVTDQPIYIENSTYVGWLHDPRNLTTADSIFDPITGAWVHVRSIQYVHSSTTVYDVVTSGFNNFVADSYLLDVKTP